MASGFADLTHRAHALVAAGDLAGARELLAPPLRGADPSPGNASPELAEAAGLHARVLLALGDAAAARGWAAFAHSAASRLYGPDDQRTVATAAALAAVLHRVGSHARAARLYRDVIIELTATDGPESLRVLAAHADLATVEHAQGECAVARNRLEDAWELHREVYGDGHVAGIRMLARLGAMQRDCGLPTEAHEHLALARELCREHLPADHPLTAQVGSLARAAASPEHVCADADPGGRESPPVPTARTGPPQRAEPANSAGPSDSAGPSAAAPGQPAPSAEAAPSAELPTDPDGPAGAAAYRPAAAGFPLEPGHPPDADLPPLAEPPTPRYPAGEEQPNSAGHPSGGSTAQVPPPRLPPAPPADPAPTRASPPRPGADQPARPRVPPPRTTTGWPYPGPAPGTVEFDDGADEDDEDLDPEHGGWPPEVVRRHPDDDLGPAGPVPGFGTGRWERDVRSAPPPAVPALTVGAGTHQEPPGGFGDGLDEADGVRRVRHLPEPRSSRLPVRIHRLAPSAAARMPMVVVAGLVLLVLLGTVAVVVGFGLTGGDAPDPRPLAPSASAPAPTDAAPTTAAPPSPGTPPGSVTLADNRGSVTLGWTYPTGAEGPVVVAGGRAGQELRAFQELPAGSTGYVVYGLESGTNYCFAVAVVYSASVVGRAEPVCTDRPDASPAAR